MSYTAIALLTILVAAYFAVLFWADRNMSKMDAVGIGFCSSMALMIAGLLVLVKFG